MRMCSSQPQSLNRPSGLFFSLCRTGGAFQPPLQTVFPISLSLTLVVCVYLCLSLSLSLSLSLLLLLLLTAIPPPHPRRGGPRHCPKLSLSLSLSIELIRTKGHNVSPSHLHFWTSVENGASKAALRRRSWLLNATARLGPELQASSSQEMIRRGMQVSRWL